MKVACFTPVTPDRTDPPARAPEPEAHALHRNERAAGILLDLPSLSRPEAPIENEARALAFLDWMGECGFSVWQLLPIGPRDLVGSPYGSSSSFAGDAALLAPSCLETEGLLTRREREAMDSVDSAARPWRVRQVAARVLRDLAQRSPQLLETFRVWLADPPNWLAEWTLFQALKSGMHGAPWTRWPQEIRKPTTAALERHRAELAAAIETEAWLQFLFFRSWERIREHARSRGIALYGDLPIYPALDSAEVWSHPELFLLDPEGQPLEVAGVPPDYFSQQGQLWGNPIYRWEVEAATGFAYWRARFRQALRLFDAVRFDHFRGFAAYWAIPRGRPASEGAWKPGPGRALFAAFEADFGRPLPAYAEDLGSLDEAVHELRRACGLPGTRVLQFGFLDGSSDHLPHRLTRDTVLFTGTHDNDTARGFFDNAPPEVQQRALDYLGCTRERFPEALLRAAWNSVAQLAIVPVQDLLGLGSEARLNTPGRIEGNWSWKLDLESLIRIDTGVVRRSLELAERAAPAQPDASVPQPADVRSAAAASGTLLEGDGPVPLRPE